MNKKDFNKKDPVWSHRGKPVTEKISVEVRLWIHIVTVGVLTIGEQL